MSLSIQRATPPVAADTAHPGRNAVHQLDEALRSGDIDAAKAAYAKVAKHLPPAVLADPKSAIGQVGRALKAGDIGGAQKAMVDVALNVRQNRDSKADPIAAPVSTEPQPVSTAPTTSSTGGAAGALVNLVV